MAFSRWIQHLPWVVEVTGNAVQISIVWLFHFLGYFLVVGTTALVDLRILGYAGKGQSATKLAKEVFPWMWLGLLFVTVSGFIMFTGYASQFYPAPVFWIKICVFLLAIVFGVIVQTNVSKWDQMPSMPAAAKVVALLSLILWVGTILASVEVPAFIACI
jgi:hypothetical protein